jgi:hypothetical protein
MLHISNGRYGLTCNLHQCVWEEPRPSLHQNDPHQPRVDPF